MKIINCIITIQFIILQSTHTHKIMHNSNDDEQYPTYQKKTITIIFYLQPDLILIITRDVLVDYYLPQGNSQIIISLQLLLL